MATSPWRVVQDDTSAWKPVPMPQHDPLSVQGVPGADPGMSSPAQAAKPQPASLKPVPLYPGTALDTADLAAGIGGSALKTANNIGKLALPDSAARGLHMPVPTQQQQDQLFKPQNPMQAIGDVAGSAAQFMIPGEAEEAAASGLTKLVPAAAQKVVAPLAKVGTSALSAGAVNKAQGGDFSQGAAAGGAGAVIGQGLKSVAPAVAETALRVRGNQRLFGRTVGDAILNDTGSAIRPESIGRNAEATMSRLSPELDAADAASAARGMRGSLQPARDAIDRTVQGLRNNRAMATAGEVQPVADFLKTDALTGHPLAPAQAAPGLRALKRGLNEDYIGKWSMEQPVAQKGAARQAYGLINDQLHQISPETREIDQRISSLVPVAQQGKRVAAQAPMAQRALSRIAAHTGVLGTAGIGAAAGYRTAPEGEKVPAAIAGGLGGIILPEMVASPEGQMAAARGLNAVRDLRPAVGGLLQLNRPKTQPTSKGNQ